MLKNSPSIVTDPADRKRHGVNSLGRPSLDVHLHVVIARLTGGVSPAALLLAYGDWGQHLLMSPDKQLELVEADVTFVLSNGGHNAGIVSPEGRPNRYHQIATHEEDENYLDPDAWQSTAAHHDGSWWPCWQNWLACRSGEVPQPPPMGAPKKGYKALCDAPGTYVLET